MNLDEIRKRNEYRKRHDRECPEVECGRHDVEAYADIDALIAEVERLRHDKECPNGCYGHKFGMDAHRQNVVDAGGDE